MKEITEKQYDLLTSKEQKNFTGIVKNLTRIRYFKDGKLHRENGPAYVNFFTNHQEWVINGKWHRLDGPAMITTTGNHYYMINGEEVSEEVIQFFIDVEKYKKL